MRILGLDLSSKVTGWSIIESDTEQLDGCGVITLEKFKKKSNPLQYVKVLYDDLKSICEHFRPDVVAVEATFFQRNIVTLKMLAKIRGIAEIACLNFGVKDIQEFNASHARKTVFNEGNLTSEKIYDKLKPTYGEAIYNDGYDITDSLVLAKCMAKKLKENLTD